MPYKKDIDYENDYPSLHFDTGLGFKLPVVELNVTYIKRYTLDKKRVAEAIKRLRQRLSEHSILTHEQRYKLSTDEIDIFENELNMRKYDKINLNYGR